MKGKKPFGAAAQEAWEEAGVVGKVSKKPLGRFEYNKVLPNGDLLPCRVDVYALAVELTDFAWPEFAQRRRKWMTTNEAAGHVNEKGLGKIIEAFGAAALSATSNLRKSEA